MDSWEEWGRPTGPPCEVCASAVLDDDWPKDLQHVCLASSPLRRTILHTGFRFRGSPKNQALVSSECDEPPPRPRKLKD